MIMLNGSTEIEAKSQAFWENIVKIQDMIIDLLTEVVETTDSGMTIGHSYGFVLRAVRKEFKSNTTKNCITWYNSKLRRTDKYGAFTMPDFRPKG